MPSVLKYFDALICIHALIIAPKNLTQIYILQELYFLISFIRLSKFMVFKLRPVLLNFFRF
jgi:hypothetical protein